MQVVKFKEWECVIQYGEYPNKRTALTLNDITTSLPVVVATVNLPDVEVNKHHVLIKNYSENEGVKEALINAGVISDDINPPTQLLVTGLNISLHSIL